MATAPDPTTIAREALRQLASRRVAPTPDNYRRLYDEIAGLPSDAADAGAEKMLRKLAADLPRTSPDMVRVANALEKAVAEKNWEKTKAVLIGLAKAAPASPLLNSRAPTPAGAAEDILDQLRELLAQTLESALVQQWGHVPALVEESRALAQLVRTARDAGELTRFTASLKQFCFRLGLQGEDGVRLQQGLLRLFNLLMENIAELLADDQWLRGQIAVLREIMSGPLDLQVIDRAERNLKEVIFKQGVLRHSMNEAKATLKHMVARFVDRLGELSETTGEYHDKIEDYSRKISQTEDIGELNQLLTEVMRETRNIQASALRSRDELVAARKEVETAQEKIKQLEAELEQASEKVREDQLTGTLNRRGLDDAFEREAARTERQRSPLCLALLDIDNFKQLNDTHGHQAGDDALVYLVTMVKDTIRPNDAVARYGGEEFLILLPDTGLDEAVAVIARLQRNLTKNFFLHDNKRLLITFSAGVAQRMPGESQETLVARADKTLYLAKQAGKNRVLAAQHH